MKQEYITLALLFGAALALALAWELLNGVPRTPIPESIRKAFEE